MEDNNSFLVLFLGPVKEYLENDEVSEIMINGPKQIYVEMHGKLQKTPAVFPSEQALKAAASNIAKSVGRILNDDNPRLDARLPDGSRVHVVIPPLCRCGTAISIRKFKKEKLTAEKLLSFGSMSEDMFKLIRAMVKLHKNIIVSGGTSSGKTSILNVLSSFIQDNERVIVMEDASELQLQQEHVLYMETRKADKNGNGEVTIRDLLHSSLRLRPDRVVVGEIRGGEAIDLLQALNTGHAGSMSTIHANSPIDALSRLETCSLMSGLDIPLSALRSQVASAIDAVVHTGRLSDGSRKIVAISEVMPLKNGEYQMNDLVRWKTRTIDSERRVIGDFHLINRPTFLEDAALEQLEMPDYPAAEIQ
ncbi:MAG: CpaF family protein [Lentisphaeria bacterium]|nr:CpaF family protein [Lentisphaeria bacterium]